MSDNELDFTNKILDWVIQNTKYIVIGVFIGIAIPLTWNYLEFRKEKQNIIASDLYSQLIENHNNSNFDSDIEKQILDEHDGTIYELLSKFILSKEEFEKKNYTLSKKYLEDIIDLDINKSYNDLAKIKISLINIEEKNYDEALKYLDMVKMQEAFKQVLLEMKGDIYKYKGDKVKSLEFYNKALEATATNKENLLMKQNSVKN